jgi:hypothetical protein
MNNPYESPQITDGGRQIGIGRLLAAAVFFLLAPLPILPVAYYVVAFPGYVAMEPGVFRIVVMVLAMLAVVVFGVALAVTGVAIIKRSRKQALAAITMFALSIVTYVACVVVG